MSFGKQIAQLASGAGQSVLSSVTSSLGQSLSAMLLGGKKGYQNMQKSMFGTGLTDAQKEANAWTAGREDTAYQRSVADMQAAGLNPALMYGSAGSTSASSSVSPSDGASLSDMLGSATALSQIQSMKVQNEVAQKQAGIAQQNADTARQNSDTERFNAETERMRVEQGIEESKSRISLNQVEELYKKSGITLNEKQLEKMTAEINNLNSEIDYRDTQLVLQALEIQIKEGQLKVNQDYYDLAVRKWNEGEKAECLMHIALMEQQSAFAAAQADAQSELADLYYGERLYTISKDRREAEYQRLYFKHLNAELEQRKKEFKESLEQALKIVNKQIDAQHLDKLADNLFNTLNTGISTAGQLAGDLSTPFNIDVHTSTRDVYNRGYKVGTETHTRRQYSK